MARKVKSSESTGSSKKIRPALTPEARELQMISLAVDLAERQLLEGTAASQVITHYLKLGSSREKLERERLEEENNLLRAKVRAIDSTDEIKDLYKDAIMCLRIRASNKQKRHKCCDHKHNNLFHFQSPFNGFLLRHRREYCFA